MRVPLAVRENLTFLLVEVGSQVSGLRALFETASLGDARQILDRSGYAYNLKMRIHEECIDELRKKKSNGAGTLALRAMESIATDLERIAELCRHCLRQAENIRIANRRKQRDYAALLARVEKGVSLIGPAVDAGDAALALEIGRIEVRLDREFKKLVARFEKELKTRKNAEDALSHLFIAHRIEEMGDSLLDIGEAILSVSMGRPLSIDRYHTFQDSVKTLDDGKAFSTLGVEPIAETKSGGGVSGITCEDDQDGYIAVFKDGKKRKLKEERERVEAWNRIQPGLAPKILSYRKRGERAALLIEHLPGLTFEQILLDRRPKLLDAALKRLKRTLRDVWSDTQVKKPVAGDYTGQLARRIDEVYAVHSDFRSGGARINGLAIPHFDALLEKARAFEDGVAAPFSVFIHGDFNLDNIIYDETEKDIRFIDLHRSRNMDYVQDISVFMVSLYRLQTLDAPMRRRARAAAVDFSAFARTFARRSGDKTFEARLALALARSFATSTRFILDPSLAGAMFMRARYLLERALEADPKSLKSFKAPVEDLFVGY